MRMKIINLLFDFKGKNVLQKNNLRLYLLGVFMTVMIFSGCGSVNGLNIKRTAFEDENAVVTFILSDTHSWIVNDAIANIVDDKVVYTAFESGQLKNIDVIKKDIVVTLLEREVKVFLVLQDIGDGLRIIDQSVQYDACENDEETYGGDIYFEFRRLGYSSEEFILCAGISQTDVILQTQIVSVNKESKELLINERIRQYMEEVNEIIVSDDKNYVFYLGSKLNRKVVIRENLKTGVVDDLTEKAGISSEVIDLYRADEFICIIVDGKQVWRMKMSDSYPVNLIQSSEKTFFEFTAGKYLVTGSDGVFQELYNIQTGEIIKLPKTFDKELTSVISNKLSTKIMFITELNNKELERSVRIEIYDIETGKLVKILDGASDLSKVIGVSWFDNDRIILQGTDIDKIAYEILEEKK